jgi:hypothetical protein
VAGESFRRRHVGTIRLLGCCRRAPIRVNEREWVQAEHERVQQLDLLPKPKGSLIGDAESEPTIDSPRRALPAGGAATRFP